MRFKIIASISFALCVLSGCERVGTEQAIEPESMDLDWQQLTDGSFVARYGSDPSYRGLKRCWQSEGEFSCFDVLQMGEMFLASAYEAPDPRKGHSRPRKLNESGYSCSFFAHGGFSESVSNGIGEIDSNVVDLNNSRYSTKAWSRDHVEGLFNANSIEPDRPYFDCAEMAALIVRASLEAATSSNIKQSILS